MLANQQMAFTANRRAASERLHAGDQLILYSTRGAWHNPTRDRGRLFGLARVTGSITDLPRPIQIAGRTVTASCPIQLDGLAAYPDGVNLADLIDQMDAFPKPHAWSIYLRRPLLPLTAHDAALLVDLLTPRLKPAQDCLGGYREAARASA